VGFELDACVAVIDSFFQEGGHIDHTININQFNDFKQCDTPIKAKHTMEDHSDVTITHSTIRASVLHWGDCVRLWAPCTVMIRDCIFYRAEGGEAPTDNHGISINGCNSLVIENNRFMRLPWAIINKGESDYPDLVRIENNRITDCELGGIRIRYRFKKNMDMGGGDLNGLGNNYFNNPNTYDIYMDDSYVDMPAKYNWWTHADPDQGIWDKLDDPILGRVNYRSKPNTPEPIMPPNDAVDQSITPQLVWSPCGGAKKYHLQVSGSNSFSQLVYENALINQSEITVPLLANSKRFYWRVNAVNDEGASEWSEVFTFGTSDPPMIPVLLSPPDSLRNAASNIAFSWKPVPNLIGYHLQVSKTSTFDQTIYDMASVVSTKQEIGPLEFGAIYFWRVRADTRGGTSAWSEIFTFRTADPPMIPVLISPPDGLRNAASSIALSWNPVPNLIGYHLQVSKTSSFDQMVFEMPSVTKTEQEIGPLKFSTAYYWRVRANTSGGMSDWSKIWFFITEETSGLSLLESATPKENGLHQNYPNPFNHSTSIRFSIATPCHVTMKIYNLTGGEAESLIDGEMPAGTYHFIWQAKGLPSGIYFIRLAAGDFIDTRKLILDK